MPRTLPLATHGQLAARVAEVAATLPDISTGRRLVHVLLTADPAAVTAYLAVLLAGHVPLVSSSAARLWPTTTEPDLRLAAGGRFETVSIEAQHLPHPDLALLDEHLREHRITEAGAAEPRERAEQRRRSSRLWG